MQNSFDFTTISEVLCFIKGSGESVSRYSLDKYLTINVKIDQSFNVVPKYLLEQGLILINKGESGTFIKLTEKGNDCVDVFYRSVTSTYDYIEAKYSSIENLSISKYLPFLTINDEKIHLKIKCQNDGDQITYILRCTNTIDNQVISETKIFDLNKKGLDLLIELIEFYLKLNKTL